ncbi:hypothetical protein GCM10010466_52640 [Planomonospora alba]|uniref:Ion transport domain-containing protein n=1 Tax=Planomonospora alba TaxID=161354 RepID=A0ABP6NRW4_9ACTN
MVNAATLGLETSAWAVERYGTVLTAVDRLALYLFTAELAAKVYAYGPRFFRDPWNLFDTAIVTVSLLPAAGGLSVLRALRILRALRLISVVPSLRRVVTALLTAVPGMTSIVLLLGLVLYVAAVMGTKLYGATAPEHFGELPTSLFTLFQMMTGDGWSDITRRVMAEHPSAWAFFVLFRLVCTFVVLNLFIAVVVSAMEEEHAEESVHATEELGVAVLAELAALRAEVRELRDRVPAATAPPAPPLPAAPAAPLPAAPAAPVPAAPAAPVPAVPAPEAAKTAKAMKTPKAVKTPKPSKGRPSRKRPARRGGGPGQRE